MTNINTKEYWESRFKTGNWNKAGQRQTYEYAIANTANLKISKDFQGSILDFGCALGDAMKVYRDSFPKAKLIGTDVSEAAIAYCTIKWGSIAEFYAGDSTTLIESDIIIASHIMEHITNDRVILKEILNKCTELYIFVPYRESPLYHEHVNYYDEEYYSDGDFIILHKQVFKVEYKINFPLNAIIRNFLRFNLAKSKTFSKDIIMFHLKGNRIQRP